MGTQQFCLKWNNHHSNMLSVFEQLLSNEALVDVTLACEGVSIKAHKVVLSACSPFFQTLFVDNPCKHPIVIMKDMRYVDLKAIIDFIYHGEVNVSQDQLSALLKTAETLKVKGLAEVGGEKQGDKGGTQELVQQPINNSTLPSNNQHRAETPPIHKRKRGRPRRRSGSSHSDTEDQVPSKIKQPDSPEIISDISRDGVVEASQEVNQRLSVSQSRVPSISSSQSVNSHKSSHSMYSSVPSQQESGATIEEPAITDSNFDLEPSRLMEQTMTAGSGVSIYEPPPVLSTSSALALPSSSALREAQSSNSVVGNQAIIPTSLHSASDSSASGLGTQDTLEDIKPFVSFEEPPVTASVQSQDNSNAMMPYMDTSGVAAIPGPSSYQPDMSLTPSQTSQQPSQVLGGTRRRGRPPRMGFFANRRNQCPICKISYTNKSILENHMNMHRPQRQMYYCDICNKGFFWRTNVYSHKRMVHHTPPLRLPFPASSNAPVSPKSNTPFPSIPPGSNPLSPQSPSFAQLASHKTPPSTPLPPAFPGHMPQGSGFSSSCAKISQSCAFSDPANISPPSVSSVSQSCSNNFGHSLINHKQPPLSSTSLEKSSSSINLTNAVGFSSLPQFPQPIGICSDPFPTMSPTISSLSLSSAYSPVLRPPAGSAASPAFSGQSQSTKSSESSEYSQLYSAASPDFFSDS